MTNKRNVSKEKKIKSPVRKFRNVSWRENRSGSVFRECFRGKTAEAGMKETGSRTSNAAQRALTFSKC